MRLTRIKLAGFKSFVDPTSVNFPSNLTGVVGPNGCGKSNIIDAVRWVMGEISAKHLRGDSMADVIFNGSSARKPVGTASIELVFDNSDGKIGGQYASYAEVSLKRVVTRDGQSTYLINGAKCRRKDITQLFLGTGLGSRSYAIIEQGMISRLIEAKPEELRAFLEEAAGISRYKERRRETENRIARTRENIQQLNLLRDEVEKQIARLQRQAATARRYQVLKEEERKLAAELLALRLRELDADSGTRERISAEREVALQAAIAEQRAIEAGMEKARAHQDELGEVLNQVQGRSYQFGAEVTRTEQTILHTRELRQRQKTDLEKTERDTGELTTELERDQSQIDELLRALATLEPEHAATRAREEESLARLADAEETMQVWQESWERHTASAGEALQRAEVERARIEQIEKNLHSLLTQQERLQQERLQLEELDEGGQLADLTEREQTTRLEAERLAGELRQTVEQLQAAREEERAVNTRLEQARKQRERASAEVISLDALQKAALGRDAGKAAEWLKTAGLTDRPRIAEMLEVQAGWESAVETVLGDDLEAVSVETLDELTGSLSNLTGGRLTLMEARSPGLSDAGAGGAGALAAKVTGPAALTAQLEHVLTADSLAEALQRRASLRAGQSFITRGGEWVGPNWLRVSRGVDHHAGVIEREHRLKTLRAEAAKAERHASDTAELLVQTRDRLAELEQRRDDLQRDVNRLHHDHSGLKAHLDALNARVGETAARIAKLAAEADKITVETQSADTVLRGARGRLEEALDAMQGLESRRVELEGERDRVRQLLNEARAQAQADQARAREVAIEFESRRSAQASKLAGLERMRAQLEQLTTRRTGLSRELQSGEAPLAELEQKLEEALRQRHAVEGELAEARNAVHAAEEAVRALDEQRLGIEAKVERARTAVAEAKLDAQTTRIRRESIAEQFATTHFELQAVLEGLPPEANIPAWEQTHVETSEKIERLGSVNLAAIDEFKEQSERKEYLDRQLADLNEALTTLETAIRKIDKETRQRFQDTFDRVNAGLQQKFPRLFGGGSAYLELTAGEEDGAVDVLNAGVTIMARPPGKRNSTIHLLSGGEKALTAVALVFSIFELNPAPFCLLDEVDAPLDEHNVGRFCEIVKDMSQRVQFIFITHNKGTMELASQLVGVTMSEPGVSRLVAVDVDEAVRMAAM